MPNMKIKEAIKDDLISAIGDEIGAKGMYGQTSNAATEIIKSMSELKKELGEIKKNNEKLKGGKADKKTLMDIVKKHDPKGYYHHDNVLPSLKKQLNKGIKVEMEHTKDRQKAKEIAMDHLYEDPKYYDKLEKIEGKEATGAVGAGGFSQPLFSVKKKDIEDVTKVETKEATGSVSSGSYVTTAAWAKSTKKKDWRGKSKTQIPGGKFVQVKKKCKKFPYCNQGDIGALKFTNENVADNVIKRLSEKYNLKESIIRDILSKHYDIKK